MKKQEQQSVESKDIQGTIQEKTGKTLKILFWILAAAIGIALPIMSLDAGISGDEFVNYEHAEYVYDYFTKGDTTCMHGVNRGNGSATHLEYYGQSFDNITYFINKVFNVDNPYEMRHFLNGLCGSFTILIIGLFLVKTCGYRAGILGLLLLFLSPRFIGHSFNNPKDIPFALGYAFTIYQIMLLVNELPKTSIKRLIFIGLGIAMANSVRIGGLILIPYLFLFCGCWYFFANPEKGTWKTGVFWKNGFILIGKLAAVCIAGYFLSLVLWPFALKNPVRNPIESLKMMEHFATNLRQIFEGGNIFSSEAPWYYLPKYMLISIPAVVLAGFFLSLAMIPKLWKSVKPMTLFIVYFSAIFPIFYIIYKHSNVYGGWRHVLFTYPMIVIAAGMGWETLYNYLKNKAMRFAAYAITAVLLILPLVHIVKNHPHEYVYYNEFAGGVKKNYGYYEMDYYQHSTRAATEWLVKHLKETGEATPENIAKRGGKILLASNDVGSLAYYVRKDTNLFKAGYIRYYERGNRDWDYAVIVNTYINAYQLQHGIWPPKNTIHTIDVDGKPIAAVLKRTNHSDFEANELLNSLSDTALTNDEKYANIVLATRKYRDALNADPNNEAALTGIISAYSSLRRTDSVLYFTERLTEACPSENFLSFAANNYISAYQQTKDPKYLDKVIELRKRVIESNPRAANAYYDLAMMYAQTGQAAKGRKCMENCVEKNRSSYSAHYYSAIYAAQTGNQKAAVDGLEKCIRKFPAHKEECENTIAQIQGRR